MSASFRPQGPRISFGHHHHHHHHQSSFITGTNDLRCWRALKPQIYIHTLWSASFANPYIASPTSKLILQTFRRFTYVTAHSTALPLLYVIGTLPTSPGEPPVPLWWCLIYPWWFCNLQWLRPAGFYGRCKLALELKRLKTPDIEEAIKAFPEGRRQCHAPELLGVPHSRLQRLLRTGQDKPLKSKGIRTMFTLEQDKELSRIVKLSACAFGLERNGDPIIVT